VQSKTAPAQNILFSSAMKEVSIYFLLWGDTTAMSEEVISFGDIVADIRAMVVLCG